jgi:hypothetical protein
MKSAKILAPIYGNACMHNFEIFLRGSRAPLQERRRRGKRVKGKFPLLDFLIWLRPCVGTAVSSFLSSI